MQLPNKTLERKLFKSGYDQIIGVDEVGMGCLAGPVLVCAVAFDNNFFKKKHPGLNRIRDSKLLLPKEREKYAKILMSLPNLRFQLAYCRPKTIDKINIYQAARLAMRRAIKKLIVHSEWGIVKDHKPLAISNKRQSPRVIILVDGPYKISNLKIEQMAIVKGDRKIFAITCASVIAKVVRDKMMVCYDKKYTGYHFAQHKGYGTKLHQVKLSSLGPSPIHRRSFAPVIKLL